MKSSIKLTKCSFVGQNNGIITDCHAHSYDSNKKITFCAENTGTLVRSFEIEKPRPTETAPPENPFTESDHQEYSKTEASTPTITIQSKEDLIAFQKKVNQGDPSYLKGNVELLCDIDLSKEHWTPIGSTNAFSFQGTFYGNGHTISSLHIKQTKLPAVGFFGYIKNATIRDLTISGSAQGGTYTGLFTGVSTNSTIQNSNVYGMVSGKGFVGLFAGQNTGSITNCYAEGKFHASKKPALVISGIAVSCTIVVVTLAALQRQNKTAPEYFPAIPIDNGVERLDYEEPVKGKNSISCDFSTKLTANKKGKVTVGFKNPGSSNQFVIMQLQITDKELLSKIGKTGRTQEEQSKLDKLDTYDPAAYRVVIGKSGTIPPGFKLDKFTLEKLPDGTTLPSGEYEAIVYLSFYDIHSNSESMIHTQSPVKLIVE